MYIQPAAFIQDHWTLDKHDKCFALQKKKTLFTNVYMKNSSYGICQVLSSLYWVQCSFWKITQSSWDMCVARDVCAWWEEWTELLTTSRPCFVGLPWQPWDIQWSFKYHGNNSAGYRCRQQVWIARDILYVHKLGGFHWLVAIHQAFNGGQRTFRGNRLHYWIP